MHELPSGWYYDIGEVIFCPQFSPSLSFFLGRRLQREIWAFDEPLDRKLLRIRCTCTRHGKPSRRKIQTATPRFCIRSRCVCSARCGLSRIAIRVWDHNRLTWYTSTGHLRPLTYAVSPMSSVLHPTANATAWTPERVILTRIIYLLFNFATALSNFLLSQSPSSSFHILISFAWEWNYARECYHQIKI